LASWGCVGFWGTDAAARGKIEEILKSAAQGFTGSVGGGLGRVAGPRLNIVIITIPV
jgi:hypothetical protein